MDFGQQAMERFRSRFTTLRREREWSAQKVANRCAQLGAARLNRRVISKIDTGERSIGLDDAVVLCEAIGVDIAAMLSAERLVVHGQPIELD